MLMLISPFPPLFNDSATPSRCQLGDTSLPEQGPEPGAEGLSEELLQRLHHILLEIHVVEGAMVCPNCSHVFPIRNGIPNMVSPRKINARCPP